MLGQPTIIWGLDIAGDRATAIAPDAELECAPGPGDFRWLHLNLADQRTRRWIEASAFVPEPLVEMLLSSQRHQQALVIDGFIGCVLHDVERDFYRLDAERTAALRFALGPKLMVTARLQPVRSADIVKSRIESGNAIVSDAATALDTVVAAIVDNVAAVAREQAGHIEQFEDILLDKPDAFDNRRLIEIRRRIVQFHRLLSGMRAVFKRLESDDELPEDLLPTVEKLAQQLGEIDSDMIAIQGQLRLLREEADLQATQRTNQNLYVLSILSALLMPATLVTGFFGMNTGGLPFASGGGGTIEAAVAAIVASAGVYALLRIMGLVNRN